MPGEPDIQRRTRHQREAGFTLVELAVVFMVIALLMGGLLVPLSTQFEQHAITETRNTLDEIKEALIGFAIANGRLPCPAQSATNGLEKATCTAAADRHGFIPWATLGVTKLDAWGHIFRYSVTPAYASPPVSLVLIPAPTARDMTIKTRDSTGALVNLSNSNDIPAVILSHGKNGYGSTSIDGIPQPSVPGANVDENTNATNATTFVSRTLSPQGVPGGEFDDLVVWVSPSVLFNRLVAAGRLP